MKSNFNNELKQLIKVILTVDKAEAGFQSATAALMPHMKASAANRKAIFCAIAAHYGLEVGPSQRDNEWGNVTLQRDGSENFKRASNRWEYIVRLWRNATPSKPAPSGASGASDPVATLVGNVAKALDKMSAPQRARALKAIAKLA